MANKPKVKLVKQTAKDRQMIVDHALAGFHEGFTAVKRAGDADGYFMLAMDVLCLHGISVRPIVDLAIKSWSGTVNGTVNARFTRCRKVADACDDGVKIANKDGTMIWVGAMLAKDDGEGKRKATSLQGMYAKVAFKPKTLVNARAAVNDQVLGLMMRKQETGGGDWLLEDTNIEYLAGEYAKKRAAQAAAAKVKAEKEAAKNAA